MKKKSWLLNPFQFIAGYKALIIGLGAMAITAILCSMRQAHLDGVIDMHLGRLSPTYIYFVEPVIDWLCLIVPLYISGVVLSASRVRFIDVAGTSALARYPMFFVVLLNLLIHIPVFSPKNILNILQTNHLLLIKVLALGLCIIPFVVWAVALMYNAYSVSANLKGSKAIWSFIGSFIFAEIISKVIIAAII